MPAVETAAGTLHCDVTDITPPWVRAPETILFHHGVGASGDIFAGRPPALARNGRDGPGPSREEGRRSALRLNDLGEAIRGARIFLELLEQQRDPLGAATQSDGLDVVLALA